MATEAPAQAMPQTPTTSTDADGRIRFSGYVQARWTGAPRSTNSFEIRRARLIAEGKLADNISYQVQADGVKPQLLDARADFRIARQLRITVGQFKIPFSYESLQADDQTDLIERSVVVNSLAPGRDNGPNNGRDLGLQFAGNLLRLREVDRIQFAVGVFNGAGINVKDDNHYKDAAARLLFRPLASLSVGGSYYHGATGTAEVGRERAGTEIVYSYGPFSAAAEYIWGHDGPVHRRGWYAETSYRARRGWQPLFRFDKYDPRLSTATLRATDNFVFGTNYFLNYWVKLQANYGEQHDLIADRYHSVFLLQTQFSFGGEKERK